jgi:hypothetical protein
MDGIQFDMLSRGLARALSRRRLGGLSIGLGLASLLPSGSLSARGPRPDKHGHHGHKGKKHKKHRNTPLVLNQFGCLDVGGRCQGNSANCCSGVCQGTKPKRGENDKSVCVAHNQDGCTPERNGCVVGTALSACNPANPVAFCLVTTGNAGFCGNVAGLSPANCQLCTKDTDCVAFGFPPGSACVLFDGGCSSNCPTTGTRACIPPGI